MELRLIYQRFAKMKLCDYDCLHTTTIFASYHANALRTLQDSEGVLVANIPSYMGGVDLWQNEEDNADNFDPQSIHDKVLEVVSISGTWHLGTLQVSKQYVRTLSLLTNIKIMPEGKTTNLDSIRSDCLVHGGSPRASRSSCGFLLLFRFRWTGNLGSSTLAR